MAQSVKYLTVDVSSACDLTVSEIEPHMGLYMLSVESDWDSLSLSLCPSPACACFLSNTFFLKLGIIGAPGWPSWISIQSKPRS